MSDLPQAVVRLTGDLRLDQWPHELPQGTQSLGGDADLVNAVWPERLLRLDQAAGRLVDLQSHRPHRFGERAVGELLDRRHLDVNLDLRLLRGAFVFAHRSDPDRVRAADLPRSNPIIGSPAAASHP